MSSQTSLSRKTSSESRPYSCNYVTDDFNSFFQALAAFQRRFFTSTVICQTKHHLRLRSAGDLQTTHVPEVSFYCCLLISGNRCSQYEIAASRLALDMGEKPYMDTFVHALAMNQCFTDPGNNTMWTNTSGLVNLLNWIGRLLFNHVMTSAYPNSPCLHQTYLFNATLGPQSSSELTSCFSLHC